MSLFGTHLLLKMSQGMCVTLSKSGSRGKILEFYMSWLLCSTLGLAGVLTGGMGDGHKVGRKKE